MVFSHGRVTGYELHPHRLGTLGKLVQNSLAASLLEVVLTPVGAAHALGAIGVDQPGQFMRGTSGRTSAGLPDSSMP